MFIFQWLVSLAVQHFFLSKIAIGEEVSLAMIDMVKTWNVREYTLKEQVPQLIYERNALPEKMTALAGLCGDGTLLGQYIFDLHSNFIVLKIGKIQFLKTLDCKSTKSGRFGIQYIYNN